MPAHGVAHKRTRKRKRKGKRRRVGGAPRAGDLRRNRPPPPIGVRLDPGVIAAIQEEPGTLAEELALQREQALQRELALRPARLDFLPPRRAPRAPPRRVRRRRLRPQAQGQGSKRGSKRGGAPSDPDLRRNRPPPPIVARQDPAVVAALQEQALPPMRRVITDPETGQLIRDDMTPEERARFRADFVDFQRALLARNRRAERVRVQQEADRERAQRRPTPPNVREANFSLGRIARQLLGLTGVERMGMFEAGSGAKKGGHRLGEILEPDETDAPLGDLIQTEAEEKFFRDMPDRDTLLMPPATRIEIRDEEERKEQFRLRAIEVARINADTARQNREFAAERRRVVEAAGRESRLPPGPPPQPRRRRQEAKEEHEVKEPDDVGRNARMAAMRAEILQNLADARQRDADEFARNLRLNERVLDPGPPPQPRRRQRRPPGLNLGRLTRTILRRGLQG